MSGFLDVDLKLFTVSLGNLNHLAQLMLLPAVAFSKQMEHLLLQLLLLVSLMLTLLLFLLLLFLLLWLSLLWLSLLWLSLLWLSLLLFHRIFVSMIEGRSENVLAKKKADQLISLCGKLIHRRWFGMCGTNIDIDTDTDTDIKIIYVLCLRLKHLLIILSFY